MKPLSDIPAQTIPSTVPRLRVVGGDSDEADPRAANPPRFANGAWPRSLALVGWIIARPSLLFAIGALALSFQYFAFGPASYVKVVDAGNGTLPARMQLSRDLFAGELGCWLPLGCCGADRVLNNYTVELHSLPFAFLPGWLAYGLIMFAQRFIAGWFTFRLLRDDLGLAHAAAVIAGIAYALFHQPGIHWQWDGFTLYDGFGIPGLPLLLWLIQRLHDRESRLSYVLAAATGAVLAGTAHYFQALFFPFLVLFWFGFVKPSFDRKLLAIGVAMAVGWLAVCLPDLIGAWLYAPLSHRADIVVASDSPFVRFIENVERWPLMVLESNRIVLAAAGIGLVVSRFSERRLISVLSAIGLILAFVAKYHFFSDAVFSRLGMLSSFHFHRLIYLVPFLAAVAAGLGIHAIWSRPRISLSVGNWTIGGGAGGLVAVGCWLLLMLVWGRTIENRQRNMLHGESFGLLYAHPDIQAIADRKAELPDFRIACVTDAWRTGMEIDKGRDWSFSPGYAWAYGLETADGYMVMYSRRYKEFWSQVLAPLLAGDKERFQQHAYWGNMVYLWTPSDSYADPNFAAQYDLDLLSLANVRFIVSPHPLVHDRLVALPSDIRDALIERRKLRSGQKFSGILKGEWPWKPVWVYENRDVLPRYFLAPRVRLFDDTAELLAALRESSAAELRRTALVHRDDLPESSPAERLAKLESRESSVETGTVEVVSRSADRIELTVNAAVPCLLHLANSYSPYWKATVDGADAPLFPVNQAFQGVTLEPGRHKVVLTYQPPYAWWR